LTPAEFEAGVFLFPRIDYTSLFENKIIYKEVKWLDQTDAAYIAGLIDGEGTVTLSRRHQHLGNISPEAYEKQMASIRWVSTGTG
jgi:hypothetical protein